METFLTFVSDIFSLKKSQTDLIMITNISHQIYQNPDYCFNLNMWN